MTRKERIQKAFNDLRADNLQILDHFYHSQIIFEDPLGRIETLKSLKDYYASMYENVTDISFNFSHLVEEGDSIMGSWTMSLKAKGLNKGEAVLVKGVSHMKFDSEKDLVIYHRDYFDMGEMIYEHIPLLGATIKLIKKKMGH